MKGVKRVLVLGRRDRRSVVRICGGQVAGTMLAASPQRRFLAEPSYRRTVSVTVSL